MSEFLVKYKKYIILVALILIGLLALWIRVAPVARISGSIDAL